MNNYLIVSSSYKLIDIELKKIVKDQEYTSINLSISSIENLFEELSYSFFDNDQKIIVIKNAPFFDSKKKCEEDEKRIFKYLESNNQNNILIFISQTIDSRKKIVKLFKEQYTVIEQVINYKNIYDYINNYIKDNKYTSDYNFAKYMVNLYGLNFDLIVMELEKIFLFFAKPCQINTNEVKDIISVPFDDNIFHFIGAVINKENDKVYKLLNELKLYKVDAVNLLMLLAREFRILFDIKKMYENRMDFSQMLKELKMQEWQLNKKYQESLIYSEKEILNFIKEIAIYDEKIKSGKIDKDAALKLFILNTMT